LHITTAKSQAKIWQSLLAFMDCQMRLVRGRF